MPPHLVSVIIVSFNTRDLLRRCLASLHENPEHRIVSPEEAAGQAAPVSRRQVATATFNPPPLSCEVIVVDNGSSDGSPEMVERDFPEVILLGAGENLGFARATNMGLSRATGGLLLLLNPDTEVVGGALPALVACADAHPEAGAVAPALTYPDGGYQHAAFRFPSLWMSLFDFFPVNHRLADSRLNGRYPRAAGNRPFPIDHPLGAAMMIQRKALRQIGPLDERFFMYCEEVDWCLRARKLGWKIYQVPEAKVVHHSGQSTGQMKEEMFVELHRSRVLLFRKHYSARFLAAHKLITGAGLLRRVVEAWWAVRRGRLDSERYHRRVTAYRAVWGL